MRLVGYCRVSSIGQADNSSLLDQRKKIKAFCTAFDHKLIAIYDEVESGKNASDRPIFNQAIQKVKDSADGIIVTKLDRIARNTRDVLELVEDVLQPNDKKLILMDLNINTNDPMGKMVLTIMAAVASLERDTINERLKIGREAKKAKNGYIGGKVTYGYRLENDVLIPDSDEQAVIEIINNHYKSGKTFYSIAQYLNDNNHSSKSGKKWTYATVQQIYKRLYPELYPIKATGRR